MDEKTQVLYWIPADGDEEEHPNVFYINKNIDSIKLSDVRAKFPVPGQYHFRAKFQFKTTYVWLDTVNGDAKVPKYENVIFLKASRLKRVGGKVPPSPEPAPVVASIKPARSSDSLSKASPASPSPPLPETAKERKGSLSDLFGIGPTSTPSTAAPVAVTATKAATPSWMEDMLSSDSAMKASVATPTPMSLGPRTVSPAPPMNTGSLNFGDLMGGFSYPAAGGGAPAVGGLGPKAPPLRTGPR